MHIFVGFPLLFTITTSTVVYLVEKIVEDNYCLLGGHKDNDCDHDSVHTYFLRMSLPKRKELKKAKENKM